MAMPPLLRGPISVRGRYCQPIALACSSVNHGLSIHREGLRVLCKYMHAYYCVSAVGYLEMGSAGKL